MGNSGTRVDGMAEAVERRRLELGLTIGDMASASGLTRQGLQRVRNGEVRNYSDKTVIGVARALHWRTDWYDRFVAGCEPVEDDAVAEAPPTNGDTHADRDERIRKLSPQAQAIIDAAIAAAEAAEQAGDDS